ncbi:MAG: hypothetical protein IPJ32_12305 [Sphingobacteriaceae bacterium]|nr:hypothetical protein [Sphingobacteriaceae bacterium]
MEIITIFEEDNPVLSASLYNEDEQDEYTKLFENWQDPEFLEDFFNTNKENLDNYNKIVARKEITVKEAIEKTIIEGKTLESKLLQLAENTTNQKKPNLDEMSIKLNNRKEFELIPHKAYGKSWLRIYAVQLESNVYVVTGGMIKLTHLIEDTEYGKLELQKIARTKGFLKEIGCFGLDGLL